MGDDLKAYIGDEQVDDNDANVYLFLTSPSSSHAPPTPSLDVSVVPVWFPTQTKEPKLLSGIIRANYTRRIGNHRIAQIYFTVNTI